jgi:hypothetical protein
MAKDIIGYACSICGTPNPESSTYCVKCGTWLFDTEREAKPLSKKELKQYFKKDKKNPYFRMAFWQGWFVLIFLYDLAIKSQIAFDRTFVAYFIGLAIYNIRLGNGLVKKQAEDQVEEAKKDRAAKMSQAV